MDSLVILVTDITGAGAGRCELTPDSDDRLRPISRSQFSQWRGNDARLISLLSAGSGETIWASIIKGNRMIR